MKRGIFILLLIFCLAYKTSGEENTDKQEHNPDTEMAFNKEQWGIKEGKNYLYRDKMLRDVVYNDTIRSLSKQQLLELLGEPDYTREGHLYYRITDKGIGNWSIKTKTMVIKLIDDTSVEWIKIHE